MTMERRYLVSQRQQQFFLDLIQFGIKEDRALRLSVMLAELDPIGIKPADYNRWVNEWANLAWTEQFEDAMNIYDLNYNKKTGGPWQVEEAERQGIQAQITEASHATQMEQVRQQNIARREKEINKRVQAGLLRKGIGRTQTEISAPILEGLREQVSPAAQIYFQRELPGIYSQQDVQRAREKYAQDLSKKLRALASHAYTGILEEKEKDELKKEIKEMKDPWEQFLSTYPFMQKFTALSPEERGYYSGRYKPPTRYLAR